MTITAATIECLIRDNLEDEGTPRAILAFLLSRDGKTLTKRDESKLQVLLNDPTVSLYNSAGMAYLEWGGYRSAKGNEGGCFLLGYTTKAPVCDAKWIEDRNQGYLNCRNERNAKRLARLRDRATLGILADHIEALQVARHAIDRLLAGEFSSDRYAIEKLAGV